MVFLVFGGIDWLLSKCFLSFWVPMSCSFGYIEEPLTGAFIGLGVLEFLDFLPLRLKSGIDIYIYGKNDHHVLPWSPHVCLFLFTVLVLVVYMDYLRFLVVFNGRNREKYVYSLFPEAKVLCNIFEMTTF